MNLYKFQYIILSLVGHSKTLFTIDIVCIKVNFHYTVQYSAFHLLCPTSTFNAIFYDAFSLSALWFRLAPAHKLLNKFYTFLSMLIIFSIHYKYSQKLTKFCCNIWVAMNNKVDTNNRLQVTLLFAVYMTTGQRSATIFENRVTVAAI